MPLPIEELGQVMDDEKLTTHVDMLIYCRSGGGKTYRTSSAPGPIYLATPDLTGHKSYPYKVQGKVVRRLDDLREVLEGFQEGGHGFKTLVIDGLTFLHDMYVREMGQYWVDHMGAKDPDLLPINARQKILARYKDRLRDFIDLTQVENPKDRVHVIFTTLEDERTQDEGALFQTRPLFGTKSMNQEFPALFSTIAYIRPVGKFENGKVDPAREMFFAEINGIMARDKLGIFAPHYSNAPELKDYLS